MKNGKTTKPWQRCLLAALLCLCTSCYQLDIHEHDSDYPVAFGQHLAGFDIVEQKGYFNETYWVYHAGDLGQLPLGSREGLEHDHIWSHTFQKYLHPGEGVQHLKIRQRQTLATLVVRVITLGLFSPTELTIEGQIVRIVPEAKNITQNSAP